MPTSYVIDHVVGENSEQSWSQVIETPGGTAVVELQAESDAPEKGVTLAKTLNIFLQKEHTVQDIRQLLQEISYPELVTLLLIIPVENEILMALKGKGKILLGRNNKLVPILQQEGVLKGSTKDGDVLIAWTHGAKIINDTYTLLIDLSSSTSVIAETLRQILEQERQGGAGVVFFHKLVSPSTHSTPDYLPIRKRFTLSKLPIGNFLQVLTAKQHRLKVLSVVLGIGFIISVLLGVYRQKNNEEYNRLDRAYTQAQQLFTEGVALIDREKLESKDRLKQALSVIETAERQGIPKSKIGKKLGDLKLQIQDNLRIASNIIPVTPSEYFSAELLRTERVITHTAINEDTIFFLDSTHGFVGAIDIDTKNADVLSGENALVGTTSLAVLNDELYLLNQSDILKVIPGSQTPQKVSLSLEGVQSKDTVVTFGTNLYVVDKTERQVWRYAKNDKGVYQEKQRYFLDGIQPDFSVLTNTAIDGSVWFGSTQGKVYKYSQGKDDPFIPRGLDIPFGKEVFVYTSEFVANIYVLDTEYKRVVVLSPDAKYLAQYEWESDDKPTALLVSEKHKKAFLLQSQKLFSFALQ